MSFNEGADVVAISSLWSVHGREGDVSVVREEAKYSFFKTRQAALGALGVQSVTAHPGPGS